MQKMPIEGFIEVSSVTMLRLSSKVGWPTHLIENCILDFFGPENESLEFILSITIFCGRNNCRWRLTSRCCSSWRRRWCRRRRLMTTMATKPSAQNWHFFETLMNIVSKGHSNAALRKKSHKNIAHKIEAITLTGQTASYSATAIIPFIATVLESYNRFYRW